MREPGSTGSAEPDERPNGRVDAEFARGEGTTRRLLENTARLRENVAQMRTALGALGVGSFVWRVPENRVEPDRRLRSLIGLDTDETRSLAELVETVVHPEHRRRLLAAARRATDGRGPSNFRMEVRARHADGSDRWLVLNIHVSFEEDDAGIAVLPRRATQVAGVVLDITAKKQRAANLTLLEHVASDFARLSLADDIMCVVGDRVGLHLSATSFYLLDIDESRDEFRADYVWGPSGLAIITEPRAISEFVSEQFRRDARSGATIVVEDTASDPRTNAAAYRKFDIGSFITVPFLRDGDWRYLVAVCDSNARRWRQDEIEVFRELAGRLVPRIERARAEAIVASDLRDTQLLRDLSAQLVHESDTQAFFEAIVAAAVSITGADAADIHFVDDHGDGLVPLTGPARRADARRTNHAVTQSTPLITRAGRTIGVLSTYWPNDRGLSARSRRFLELLARQAAELIERRRSDDALRASERRLSAEVADLKLLHQVSAQLIQDQGSASLFDTILDAAASIMHSTSVSLQMLHSERGSGGVLHLIASRGFSATAIKRWEWVQADAGTTCAASLRTGARVVVPDIEQCEFMRGTEDLAGYRFYGIRAGQSTPLVSRSGKVLGMISTHWADVHRPSERDFRLLDILSRQAADLMERSRAEEALRHSERELKEADRRKDEFLATLAHELRNPLAPLRTSLELIRLAGDTPGAVEDIRAMMEEQLGQIVRLVDDLLDVSRITSGKIQLHRQPTSLVTLVNAAVHANQAALHAGRVALKLEMPNVPVILHADPTRFVQVISNVLHNAVKFTDAGGSITIAATVAPATDDSRDVTLEVIDSGVGISADMLPRVFERFTQDDDAAQRSHAGLGIGLSLARQLIELHGGSIEAFSAGKGKGSTFTIRVPVLEEIGEQRPPVVVPETPRTKRRVVVIDDNPAASTSMQRLVRVLGGECRVAFDGEAGIKAVREFQPDVVILDIGMPGIDGYETCRRIRAEFGPNMLVVALTGWGQERDKKRAWRAGFDVHLTKPADPIALEALLAGTTVAELNGV